MRLPGIKPVRPLGSRVVVVAAAAAGKVPPRVPPRRVNHERSLGVTNTGPITASVNAVTTWCHPPLYGVVSHGAVHHFMLCCHGYCSTRGIVVQPVRVGACCVVTGTVAHPVHVSACCVVTGAVAHPVLKEGTFSCSVKQADLAHTRGV